MAAAAIRTKLRLTLALGVVGLALGVEVALGGGEALGEEVALGEEEALAQTVMAVQAVKKSLRTNIGLCRTNIDLCIR